MKILEKKVDRIYRFRCHYCRSKFEMTEAEKIENDWTYNEGNGTREEREARGVGPHNPLEHFWCPICNKKSFVSRCDMHRYTIMDNGIEHQDY